MTTYTDVEQKAQADLGPSRLSSWARRSLFTLFGSLKHGRITIEDEFGRTTFGQGQPQVTLSILDQRTYTRLLLSGSVGAAESYIDGMWKCDDLTTLMRIIIRNMALLDKIESTFGPFLQPIRKIQQWLRRNNHEGAKKNILAHYDLGNEMYKSFLDETMMYSSAIFPDENSSLEQGSIYKLEVICQKLGLSPGDRIVEIGSGWGGFAIYAASHYGCHVTTTTISDAQFEEAKLRIREAGLEEKITLLKKDYRDLTGSYDKLVSIEMIEAVGYSYLPDFFNKCESLLKPGGQMVLQAITMADQHYRSYLSDYDFIRKHIFPGGCLVANHHLLDLFTRHTTMVVRGLDDFGLDYARTLKEWHQRFTTSFEELERLGYDELFKRLWEYYFCYCEGGFRERLISVVHINAEKKTY